jgi:hypothetical protein
VSGAANSFPFLYQGLEHEVTDPGQLYFEPSGKTYNPQIQRELSQVGVQGIGGAPNDGGGAGYGGFGNFGGHAGSPGGPSNLSTSISDLGVVATAFSSTEALGSSSGFLSVGGSENPINIPISFIANLFHFGGGDDSAPPKPPKVHPIWMILGVQRGLTVPQFSGASFLAKSDDAPQSGVVLARYIAVPFSRLPEDVNQPPGNGFTEKRGPNWYNPQTGQSLHPDPTHPGTKGRHYDLHNGFLEPKGKVSLRQLFDQLQYWGPDVEQWIELEGPTLVPVE